ncbi:MAG: aldo/keto reductase [Candidatus Limnocylindrales bacterium]|jgi:aryl-alcohol dehydrogenase-like predicted oxidoreductase
MKISTRRLGTSGLEITTVGFGAWAAGGGGWAFSWGPQDDDDSIRAIVHAVGKGVNWVDTAGVYGLGHSEEVVGRALARIPASDRPLVFTKGALVWDLQNPRTPLKRIAEPASLRRDCEASLRRLGVERIDLFQIHWPDESGVPAEESWGEMSRLVDEGKVRAIGVSNYSVELLERCERVRHVDSLQPPFSMILRDSAGGVIPWAAAHGTGVIVYSPMASGILTDSFSAERVAAMAEDDWRRKAPNFNEPALSRNVALRDALLAIAGRHGTTVSAVAVAWVLAWPGISGAIVGARSPEQVDGWLGGGTLRLGPDDLAQVATAVERTGAGSGPTRPDGGSTSLPA